MKDITAAILIVLAGGCMGPGKNNEPFAESDAARVIIYDSAGREADSWKPKNGEIVVHPSEDKITFLDEETGKAITVRPSYSVIYDR